MASEYRKKRGHDTWHFCRNCTEYPAGDYTTHPAGPTRPASGELCNQCLGKERNGTCT